MQCCKWLQTRLIHCAYCPGAQEERESKASEAEAREAREAALAGEKKVRGLRASTRECLDESSSTPPSSRMQPGSAQLSCRMQSQKESPEPCFSCVRSQAYEAEQKAMDVCDLRKSLVFTARCMPDFRCVASITAQFCTSNPQLSIKELNVYMIYIGRSIFFW